RTYYEKAIHTLHQVYRQKGAVDTVVYEEIRKQTNDKNLLKYETIRNRFFAGDDQRLLETVQNYNHRIKKIIQLHEKIDVFDLEVPGTNNFALAGGVFVHNSA